MSVGLLTPISTTHLTGVVSVTVTTGSQSAVVVVHSLCVQDYDREKLMERL